MDQNTNKTNKTEPPQPEDTSSEEGDSENNTTATRLRAKVAETPEGEEAKSGGVWHTRAACQVRSLSISTTIHPIILWIRGIRN